jgi:transcription initiation factor TFIIIB Brf1 subunit/transcription initiation factor TFIIB
VHDRKALKGRALKSVFAACIFCAAKRENNPRTFKEICAVMPDVSKVDIGRCFTAIDKCVLDCSHSPQHQAYRTRRDTCCLWLLLCAECESVLLLLGY